jgi:hypothetical protein
VAAVVVKPSFLIISRKKGFPRVFFGGNTEAHLIAVPLAEADVKPILAAEVVIIHPVFRTKFVTAGGFEATLPAHK